LEKQITAALLVSGGLAGIGGGRLLNGPLTPLPEDLQ
jgi:hypothetical protein